MVFELLSGLLLITGSFAGEVSISNGPWPTPVTPLAGKSRICNIQNYGGKADNLTDVGAAIQRTFDQCVKHTPNSRLVVPEGNYLARTVAFMSGGIGWAFQLDGLITRSSAFANHDHDSFNILFFKYCKDVEIFSSNGKGGTEISHFQSQGLMPYRNPWKRMGQSSVRLSCNNASHAC